MKRAIIISNYSTQYQNPIVLKKGDRVRLGQEEMEEKWKGWIWAEKAIHGGWVPLQILKKDTNNLTAEVLEDYSAKELDVEEGDIVMIAEQLNGWVLAAHETTKEMGWIPDENIRFL